MSGLPRRWAMAQGLRYRKPLRVLVVVRARPVRCAGEAVWKSARTLFAHLTGLASVSASRGYRRSTIGCRRRGDFYAVNSSKPTSRSATPQHEVVDVPMVGKLGGTFVSHRLFQSFVVAILPPIYPSRQGMARQATGRPGGSVTAAETRLTAIWASGPRSTRARASASSKLAVQ